MKLVNNPFGIKYDSLELPDNAFIATMEAPDVLLNPKHEIYNAIENPIGSLPLSSIAIEKIKKNPQAKAVIVISDNTRPVPYRGEEGILMPIINTLLHSGFIHSNITILIATGMHREMREDEIKETLDSSIFSIGIKVINHQPKNRDRLAFIGTTRRGTNVMIDSVYMDSDLKILTGLVESHFMAGVSGGRKAVCPGIIGEESTYIFHGPELMDADKARDLVIEGNPVHEESLEIAKMAGVDFIVNVTLNHKFHITGVFAGDLEMAHLAAIDKIKENVLVNVPYEADIVITHGGFVGINHYQCAKCAVASLGALKKNGFLISLADITDKGHKIGSVNYRITVALLHLLGSENFVRLIKSPDWGFLPEQWQVQQWAKVFRKIPQDNYYFYAPQISHDWFDMLPGVDIRTLSSSIKDTEPDSMTKAVEIALLDIEKRTGKKCKDMKIVYLADGPYEIPVTNGD